MAKPVGFDQKIKLQQLDYIAREAQNSDRKSMYKKLDEFLFIDIRGPKSRKNIGTILMKIWFLVGDEYKDLQQRAFTMLPGFTSQERLVLHYGMTLLAYPFFKAMVSEMGNLFILQKEVSSQQIGRKMKGIYGDRRRVEVATSAVLMSIRAWGLIDRGKSNIYIIPGKYRIADKNLRLWLTEVIIRVSDYRFMPLELITSAQVVFPFQFKLNITEFENSIFTINRQGLDMQIVGI